MDNTCCNHNNRTDILTPELPHYGKEVCADCGKFFRWIPNPATPSASKEAESAVAKLGKLNISEREKEFLESIRRQKFFFTPKQRNWFESICKSYGIPTPQSYR